MNVVLTLVSIAVLALCLLVWLISRLSGREGPKAQLPDAVAKVEPADAAPEPSIAHLLQNTEHQVHEEHGQEAHKDVSFRMQGERGMGGPVYGDVMCADGVYLPHVWESDMHTSFDGRWLRTGFYDSEVAHLVDRKSRRSWLINAAEGELLDAVHWRVPRWNGETINESGMADDAHVVMSDASFEAWLGEHVSHAAQPLVELRDIAVPLECVPAEAADKPPHLSTAPQPQSADGKQQAPLPAPAAPELTLDRHWPASLRRLRYPLQPLQQASWQLLMNGQPTGWVLDQEPAMVWRADGQGLALYAYPQQGEENSIRRLVVWTAEKGWQQWPQLLPYDRKPWTVEMFWPDEIDSRPPLQWSGNVLKQRVQIDTPGIERLHDGTNISLTVSRTEACAGHARDGRVLLKDRPDTTFCWLRDPAQPQIWRAQSEPVLGKPLTWTLSKEAKDEQGETSAWNLQWGEKHLSGSWALEHLVVKGRWAVLMPFARAPVRGGAGQIQIWDGERLQTVDLPWPVMRISALPTLDGSMAERVELVALVASLDEKDWDPNTGSWRWNMHSVSSSHLARPDWRPLYQRRAIAPDAQGRWRLLPRWREATQIQHPCADGDYVWRDAARGDALWWWGGQNERVNDYWSEDECRIEGVSMTRSGLALCGTGPSACPHPAGEGWAVLEFLERRYGQPDRWKLHWLNPVEKELRTLELVANMPQIKGWDTQGLQWQELSPESEEQAPAPQLVTLSMWGKAEVEPLRQGTNGLWLRKQDLRYAQTLLGQDDCPWGR
ncbi:hypothetical protein DZC30_03225 [Comamonas testosteroni]|uniref:Uncharacterized protein n=1 Tax=Comamonas testosteroni TaxID=285 RepID=A0A373FRJ1_COMTE|nr:hypothetical protein [Comamonas testosteroni]RGE46786.1 hypothetical protein DZC30_03225 [Comamonas testosteroni]